MDIETYLNGALARAGAAKMNKAPVGRVLYFEGGCWHRLTDGEWYSVALYLDSGDRATAYYRREGRHHVVSDCCEGMKSFLIQTGRRFFTKKDAAAVTCSLTTIGSAGDVQTVCGVDSANLPDAICRVLLASYKVSTLAPERKE